MADEENIRYQNGVMAEDESLDPREFESQGDEHFVDEGENFGVVTVHERRRMTPRNKVIIATILVGLVIALAVVFSGGKDSGSASTGSPKVALQEPPRDLDARCSPKALTDNGKEPCLVDCERAECCDFPANLPLSCLEGNQPKCLVYHAACSHLNADSYDESTIPSSVPPAPSNLQELCTSSSLKTVDGFTGCHEACKHAECCYEEGVGTCTHDECTGYAPCLTLAATDHVHEDIPALVDQVCASDRLVSMEGRAECRQACSHALCCFAPDDQETSCLHHDTSFCSQYDKCNELESVQPVEATPEEIQLTCQDNEDVPGHISLCELVCQKGACCFSDQVCDEVASGIQCSDYEPCRKVFIGNEENGSEVPNWENDGGGDNSENGDGSHWDNGGVHLNLDAVEKEDIDTACEANKMEIVKIPDEPTLCEQVCKSGACCFDKGVKCDVADPERFCTIFSACSKLHPNEEEEKENPPVDEEAIKAACQKDDLKECENLCMQGYCCYEGAVCDVPHPERFCAHFGYCDVLDGDDADDDDDELVDDEQDEEENQVDDDMDDDAAFDDDNMDDDAALDEDNFDDNDAADYEEITNGNDGGDEQVDESWVDNMGGEGEDDNDEDESWVDQEEDENDNDNEDVDESWVDQLDDGEQGGDSNGDNDADDQIIEIIDVDGKIVGEDELHTACTTGSIKCETLCKQGACCFEGDKCPATHPERFCVAFGVCEKFYQGE